MDWRDSTLLEKSDRAGYTVLEALTTASLENRPRSFSSHSRPGAYACVDGKTYWLKGNAQQGLVAELITGRLAAVVGAGPAGRIIRLTEAAMNPDGSEKHLLGIVVGSEDIPGTVNARELEPMQQSGQVPAGLIDPGSRARVVVFQTWLGLGDSQVLVGMTDGRVYSIDHGECFGSLADPPAAPTPVVTVIPGVGPEVGQEAAYVLPALDRIESVTDDDLLKAVSQIPSGDAWQSPTDRRLAIGRWLAERRAAMRGVMESWMLQ
jgi:hypothetical protein